MEQRFWFEGAALAAPFTNNSLESFNRKIKDQRTLRDRLLLKDFLCDLLSFIKYVSILRKNEGKNRYCTQIIIGNEL